MLSSKDFMKPCQYNLDTRNQLWCSVIADSHDSYCGCETPFAHLLASIFPPGHKDRDLTVNQILNRDYKELCLSGGKEEKSHGMAGEDAGPSTNIKEEAGKDFTEEEDLDQLLAAAAAEGEEDER